MTEDEGSGSLDLSIHPDLIGGVFSDLAAVWHNQHGFTLDFICQAQPGPNEQGNMSGQIVARVRLPPSVIFQIARAIADNVDGYERTFGPISSGGPKQEGT